MRLEEFALGVDGVVFQHSIMFIGVQSTWVCDVSWHRPIEGIEPVTLNLGHDEVEAQAEATCAKCPQQTTKRCGDESPCNNVNESAQHPAQYY
jgi:hypothetical protein